MTAGGKAGIPPRHIFIVGKPRSGTTWLLSALEHHPRCLALRPETLGIAVDRPTKETGLFVRALSDAEIVTRLGRVEADAGGRVLVEKTPAHLLEVPRIRRLLPGARIVLIRRDPCDVLYSLVQKNEFWQTSPQSLPEALDLYQSYERAEQIALPFCDAVVEYARLWETPEAELTRLCEALGLDPAPVPSLVESTRGGRSLPAALKSVFREGTPGQGRARFDAGARSYLASRLGDSPPLRVIVATNHLFGYTGSEITALTVARLLREKGQEVVCHAREGKPEFVAHQRAGGLHVGDNLDDLKRGDWDAAYVQHNLTALELRECFPALPLLHACLGVLPFLEQPPFLELGAARYLAISEEVRDHLLHQRVPEERITIFRNLVDSRLYQPRGRIATVARRALVYSYKIDPERLGIITGACRRLGIDCQWVGRQPGEIAQQQVPARLNDADLVFSLGRGAIEAMMCARIPVIFDAHGGDGLVRPERLDDVARCNFSGRRQARHYTVAQLADELACYCAKDGPVLREMAIARFDAGLAVERLLLMLHEARAETPPPALPASTTALLTPVVRAVQAARSYAEQAARHVAAVAHAGAGEPAGSAGFSGAPPHAPSTNAAGAATPPPRLGVAAGEQTEETAASLGSATRVIAFHLPQFHPIPENDAWWGRGFTEWTNVARARPAFPGHSQPHLPGELGFYDLRLPATMEAQARLARAHGVDAFCFYHYWFGGRRLLEAPLETMLASGRPDFPFCLCWANESWTRAWDGRTDEVLMAESYSPEDDRAHLCDLLRFLRDPRYVRVGDRPLLLVYQASRLPDARRTASVWRDAAARAGLPGLHLCSVESFLEDRGDPSVWGFDAAVEFQPDWANLGEPLRQPIFGRHRVFDYADFAARQAAKPQASYRRYACVTPGFDNSARRPHDAVILLNPDPAVYEEWLLAAARDQQANPPDERLLFVNAWNEWGEGCHLEPDLVGGRLFLEATRQAVQRAGFRAQSELAAVATLGGGFAPGPRGQWWLGAEGTLRVRGRQGEVVPVVKLWLAAARQGVGAAPPPDLEIWAGGQQRGVLRFPNAGHLCELSLRGESAAAEVEVVLRAAGADDQRAPERPLYLVRVEAVTCPPPPAAASRPSKQADPLANSAGGASKLITK